LHKTARTHCSFDNLDVDALPNQILKGTLRLLAETPDLDPRVKADLAGLYRRFGGVSDVFISEALFRRIQVHRHIGAYRLLLAICRLAHMCAMPDEQGSKTVFRDFIRDERMMARLFQEFVFNFFRRESRYQVDRPQLRWQATSECPDSLSLLPVMQTDVVLRSSKRTIVLDTKYYTEAFQTRFGSQKVRSEHLYQIVSYLRNMPSTVPSVEGILLYPAVKSSFDLHYTILNFPIRVVSIDMALPWPIIRERLLAVPDPSSNLSVSA
jgi:5-methylcytosine-specific restriction enzyme subunit McrC